MSVDENVALKYLKLSELKIQFLIFISSRGKKANSDMPNFN